MNTFTPYLISPAALKLGRFKEFHVCPANNGIYPELGPGNCYGCWLPLLLELLTGLRRLTQEFDNLANSHPCGQEFWRSEMWFSAQGY